jgi:NAD(P)-dependent dehydrogenase (short-subunit alcohol dehydrogenase family)
LRTFTCTQWAKQLLAQGNTVVATARDPSSSPGLSALSQQYGDKLLLTSLEAAREAGIADWAAQLKGKLSHIDVSGWLAGWRPIAEHDVCGHLYLVRPHAGNSSTSTYAYAETAMLDGSRQLN